MSGGALMRIENCVQQHDDGVSGNIRRVWRLDLECGHTAVVATEPGERARCPKCKPKHGAQSPTRYGICEECSVYGPFRGRDEHGRRLCNRCHPSKRKHAERPEDRLIRDTRLLLCGLDELVGSRKPCGPARFWR